MKQIGVRCPPPMSNQLGSLRRDYKQFVDKRRRKKREKERRKRKEGMKENEEEKLQDLHCCKVEGLRT